MSTKAIPKLETREAQPCVKIPVQASFKEWNYAIEKVPQLFEWLGQNQVTPAGPLFFRYLVLGDMDRRFAIEIGMAVPEPVQGSGQVQSGEIPGGTYATYIHHGHPDEIFQVNEDIEAWARENGAEFDIQRDGDREVWTGRFEFFLTNPEEEPDPNKWATEIAYRLKDGAHPSNGA